MTAFIGRREFITLLGGAALSPVAARAQQSERMRRVGVLMGVAESDAEAQARLNLFRDTLQTMGWTVGRNVQFIYRWSAADADLRRIYAVELVSEAPDVILADTLVPF
jgi:putative ABC transport system substrate-binding protein